MVDQHTDSDEIDPLEEQVRDEPNPELVRQHDEERDPLDEAIIEQHQPVEEQDAIGAEEADGLDPAPIVDDA